MAVGLAAGQAGAAAGLAAGGDHRASCLSYMNGYVGNRATPEAARAYADCVHVVYGGGTDPGLLLTIKIWLAVTLLVGLGAAVREWVIERDLGDSIIAFVLGAVATAIVFGVLAFSVWFIVS